MSPLSVAWAPYFVTEVELGHSHFLIRMAAYGMWAELKGNCIDFFIFLCIAFSDRY